jgi:hypothetical protein
MSDYDALKERVQRVIKWSNLTISAFERKIGVTKNSINALIVNDRGIGFDKIANISATFKEINPAWILNGDGEMLRSNEIIEEPPSNVLFLEHISAVAGYSIETVTEEELSYFSIPYLPKRSRPYIAIRIQGDSMEPRFYSGDIVICYKIERFEDFKSNNYYIVNYGGEVRFKFVYASPGAADLLILKSVNTMYIEEAVPIAEVELFRVVASLKLL